VNYTSLVNKSINYLSLAILTVGPRIINRLLLKLAVNSVTLLLVLLHSDVSDIWDQFKHFLDCHYTRGLGLL